MGLQQDKEITVTKTYSLKLDQVRKLDLLEPATGKKKSELVRDAIDDLFKKHFPVTESV